MKKQIWIAIVIVFLALILGVFAWMSLSRNSSGSAPSLNGETEIIPDDPNEPWPDLTEETASDAASSSDSVKNTPTFGTAPESSVPGDSVISGGSSGSSDSSSSSGSSSDSAASHGGSSSDSSASGNSSGSADGSVSSDGSDTPGSLPGESDPAGPGPGATDTPPVVSADGLHEYELPYIPLS